jgi:hypothetical protein
VCEVHVLSFAQGSKLKLLYLLGTIKTYGHVRDWRKSRDQANHPQMCQDDAGHTTAATQVGHVLEEEQKKKMLEKRNQESRRKRRKQKKSGVCRSCRAVV